MARATLRDGSALQVIPAAWVDVFPDAGGGRDLAPVIIALGQWGDKWVAHEKGPSTVVTIRESGEPLPRIWPRRESGELLALDEVGMRWANGAGPNTETQGKENP